MKLRRWLAAGAAALLAAGVLSGCGGAKKNYVVLEGELSSEEYGIGFRKDDAALRNEVWKILVDMNKSGEFKTISEDQGQGQAGDGTGCGPAAHGFPG